MSAAGSKGKQSGGHSSKWEVVLETRGARLGHQMHQGLRTAAGLFLGGRSAALNMATPPLALPLHGDAS